MANIDTELAAILSAVYGRDVRDAIHDAIKAANDSIDDFVQGNLDTELTSTTLPAQGKAVGDAMGQTLVNRGVIPNNSDINDIEIMPGWRAISTNSNNIANLPDGSTSGYRYIIMLTGYGNSATTFAQLIYINQTTGYMACRRKSSASDPWTSWKCPAAANITAAIEDAFAGTDVFSRRDTIADDTDLDTILTCGWRMVNNGVVLTNAPENATGYRMILIFQGAGADFKQMIYINRTTGCVAMRTHTGLGWIQGWTVITPGMHGVRNLCITPQYGRKMIDICHRGYSDEAPENSLLAFKLARKYGFDWVECDVQFTSDNVPVIMHNRNLAGTSSPARNADGSIIEGVDGVLNIDSITYEQALTYDFGIKKGAQFAGMQIPTLAATLDLFRHINLCAMLHFKETVNNADRRQIVYSLVSQYGMANNVILMSGSTTTLTNISKEVQSMRIALATDPLHCDDSLVPYLQSLQVNGNEVWLSSNKNLYPDLIEYVNAAQAAGFTVTARIDDAAQAESYMQPWANIFITNGADHFVPSKYLYDQLMAEVADETE